MLVRVEKRRVTTVPIPGTRPRGLDRSEDKRLAQELLLDRKERAEHTMLVDLARNDVGRVCKFGSVDVTEFMGVEKFSHVQHLVSTVQGVLHGASRLLRCAQVLFPGQQFPGPQRSALCRSSARPNRMPAASMQVPWAILGFDRNLEFAIAIRTVSVKNGLAYIQTGAGIVADSVPEKEWIESWNKAAAMLRAIEQAGVVP